MLRRNSQYPPHVAASGIGRSKTIVPIGKCNISVDAKAHDNFRLSGKTMNMARLMILRISNEQDIAETKRCHTPKYNPSRFGYQT